MLSFPLCKVTKIAKPLILLLGLMVASSAHSAFLIGTPTNILGFDSVDVNGTLYDVRFKEDKAKNIWGANYDFTIATASETTEALTALGNLLQPYDPMDIFGITEKVGIILSPFSSNMDYNQSVAMINYSSSFFVIDCLIGGCPINNNLNTAWKSYKTYADWKVSPVPIPAAAWLFGSALIGFMGLVRIKKKLAVSAG